MMTMIEISDKLQFPRCELAKHFPNISIDNLAFVRNPYLVAGTDLVSILNGVDNNQDEFITLKNDLTSRQDIVCLLVSHDILMFQSCKRSLSTAGAFFVDLAMQGWLLSIT